MTLPILLSVPHAGLRVPAEVADRCLLSTEEIVADGDEGAREIYSLEDEVAAFVSTDVARAVVDLNRATDDRRKDGVVKTHTCWDVPIYREPLDEPLIATLLERYWHPYHARLSAGAARVRLGVDGHTMAAQGPPVGPDPGAARPAVCLGNGDGTCPPEWMDRLVACFGESFALPVSVNRPFRGGYIIRAHAAEVPWVQVELSRAPTLTLGEKRARVLAALEAFCKGLGALSPPPGA